MNDIIEDLRKIIPFTHMNTIKRNYSGIKFPLNTNLKERLSLLADFELFGREKNLFSLISTAQSIKPEIAYILKKLGLVSDSIFSEFRIHKVIGNEIWVFFMGKSHFEFVFPSKLKKSALELVDQMGNSFPYAYSTNFGYLDAEICEDINHDFQYQSKYVDEKVILSKVNFKNTAEFKKHDIRKFLAYGSEAIELTKKELADILNALFLDNVDTNFYWPVIVSKLLEETLEAVQNTILSDSSRADLYRTAFRAIL